MRLLVLLVACTLFTAVIVVRFHQNRINAPTTTRRRRLYRLRLGPDPWVFNDPHTTILKSTTLSTKSVARYDTAIATMTPLRICNRKVPISHEVDVQMMQKFGNCQLLSNAPEETNILLIQGDQTFGRTGNNLIEILHSLEYARDNGLVVAIRHYSWAAHVITELWMAVQDEDISAWLEFIKQSLCILVVDSDDDMSRYKSVKFIDGKAGCMEMFYYTSESWDRVEYLSHIIRTLYRYVNLGVGVNMRREQVGNSCSVLNAIFKDKYPKYSVIHSRSLEGPPGLRILKRIATNSGCDETAALFMAPDYIKSILQPLGMLNHPILFISDHQNATILERLMADTDIGPNIQLIPPETSWIGSDITAALMADVFTGNPASTFSGFIAKSRLAFGYDATFMFRKRSEDGNWVNACDNVCIFDRQIMHAMA